jgi:flavin-dependent dehydrogenase
MLVEQDKFPRAKLCGNFISPECLDHFEELGVLDGMLKAGGARIDVTDFYSIGGNHVSVPSRWFGTKHGFAYSLSREEMDARLLDRAREVGVEVLDDTRAIDLVMNDERVYGLLLRTERRQFEIGSRLVIDATGRGRFLSRKAAPNSKPKTRTYRVAFRTQLIEAGLANDRCEIYVFKGGYGGLSLIENGLSNLCFIATTETVRACGSDPERVMREALMTNHRAAQTLGNARSVSDWLSVAIDGFGRHDPACAEGLLSIGDAASFIDPFTGSGILMALESGMIASDAVHVWLQTTGSTNSLDNLATNYRRTYARRFNSRLRFCSMLRKAAFVPKLAASMIFVCGLATALPRQFARATRSHSADA